MTTTPSRSRNSRSDGVGMVIALTAAADRKRGADAARAPGAHDFELNGSLTSLFKGGGS